ncbi:DNA polymerase III subunit chi [Bartonella australis AUST/NH1]|uniref:DNA polymerase III subunit chi n=1 Tax=Bartonella australis (strain Aust/NH1) TaxID=1094489 RepID=M1NSN5_BARAA|nr:DNA polymerase III subunit chi [Bartonella australis]AGF74353.1 DNA polymerase III subunit chi [Bartonella australis AUST/NH1]
MDILFYHLIHSALKDTLPVLVERALARFKRVTIQCTSKERRDAIDMHLWVYADEAFIGHGTESDNYPHFQPVFLTTGHENPNSSKVRFLIEGAVCPDIDTYQRVVIMFDGHNEAQLDFARKQWKEYKTKNYNLTYWQQTEDRYWEKKA